MNVFTLRMAVVDQTAAIAAMRTEKQMLEEQLRNLERDRNLPPPASPARVLDRTA